MSTKSTLDRLKKVDLRDVWESEPYDFTPWLAEEANLKLLSDTIDIELEVEALEKGVGPYFADIVCRDTTNGTVVLIENQLEKTDHTHLGQLMTYAAGLDAVTVVWIAERFTEEHRAALDWLNENTSEKIGFFGLEVELWRIGDSAIAPKFNMVSKPNDWVKVGGGSAGASVSDTKQLQQQYWLALRELAVQRKSMLKLQMAQPQHWLMAAIGRSHFHTAALVNTNEERIAVELYLKGPDAKKHFKTLEAEKDAIEKEVGQALDWKELPEKKDSRIILHRPNSNIKDKNLWPQQHAWLLDSLERFDRVFRQRVKNLPSDYGEGEVGE